MKKIRLIVLSVLMVVLAASLAACGGNGDKPGTKTVRIEAENSNLEGQSSATHSGNISGSSLIFGEGTDAEAKKWSNGYYVGPTHNIDFTLTFAINVDKADDEAVLTVALGSEIGNITLNSQNFSVVVNGEEVNFGNIVVKGSISQSDMKFTVKKLPNSIKLKEGENTILLIVRENTLREGQVGGPMVDYIEINSSSEITYEPIDNL